MALLEEGRLVELFLERRRDRGVVGNLYKGRVNRVLPGMEAAFVDIGLERDAFLHVDDLRDRSSGSGAEDETQEGPGEAEKAIDDLLKPGEEIVVQVVKDPVPSKGARVTPRITLPGRYLVFVPDGAHLGVSRRIEDPEERERLREIVAGLPEGGWIVRTAGEGERPESFERDAGSLRSRWDRIRDRIREAGAPALVHEDLDVALRVVRDRFGPGFEALRVEGEEIHRRVSEFLQEVDPSLARKVRRHEGRRPLFEVADVEEEIEAALRSKVWLRSGGYLVIQPTEALVAIDVNTGRFVGSEDLERTILRTNLEAVREAVRQIRLRNLGGIVVLDLIDMEEAESREEVFAALEEEVRKDRARSRVLSISEFGLVEMTRKRSRPSLQRLLTSPCPYCQGDGRVKALTTIAMELREEVLDHGAPRGARELMLRAHPDLANALRGEEKAVVEELERTLGLSIVVRSDPELHRERFEVLEVR